VIRVEGMTQSEQIGDEAEADQRRILRREMQVQAPTEAME
jgi:hypothetical protein